MAVLRGELHPGEDQHPIHLRRAGVDHIVVTDGHPIQPPCLGQGSDLLDLHPAIERGLGVKVEVQNQFHPNLPFRLFRRYLR